MALDLPGHGGSDLPADIDSIEALADWVAIALDALEIKRSVIVGHSLGGWVALALARRHPDRVEGLGLLACAGLNRRLELPRLRMVLDMDDCAAAKQAMMWMAGGSTKNLPNFESKLLQQLEIPGARSCLTKIFEQIIAPACDERLPPFDWSDIKAPTQFIWGANDDVIHPPSATEGLFGKLSIIPDAGHMVHLQQAVATNQSLNEFVATLFH